MAQMEYADFVGFFGGEPNSSFIVTYHDGASKFIESTDKSLITMGNAVLMGICLEGSMMVSINGFANAVKAGDMMVILPNTLVRTSQHTPDYRARLLVGRTKAQLDIARTMAVFPDMSHYPVVPLSDGEQTLFASLFDYIATTSADRANTYRDNITNKIFMLLCYEAGNIYRRRFSHKMKIAENEMIFHTFLDVLSNNCFEHRDVAFYAKYMRLSCRTFGDKIKKATGKTPSEWIDKIVIDNAQTLLGSTEISVGDVASRLNFPNASFFCQYFKRLTGVSPQEYRRIRKSKAQSSSDTSHLA